MVAQNTPLPSGANLSDILTAIKNLVVAVGALTQNYLNVQGASIASAITVPTVIKMTGGRIARVSVTIAGSAAGTIYDGASLSATTKPIYTIPNTLGVFEVNMPVSFGGFVSPGSGQTVSVSYS